MDKKPEVIVFFDGTCSLCNGLVRFLLDRDHRGVFHFASLQSDFARDFLAERGQDAAALDTMHVYDGGSLYQRSEAVLAISHHLPGVWGLLRHARALPQGLRDRAYGWVARNRNRLLRSGERCRMPTAGERARFLG